MQCLGLNEIYRMIGYSLLSMMSNFLKLGLSGYDVKPRLGASQCEYLLQDSLFYEIILVATHPLLFWGGGVHGKACWLIAY